MDLDQLRGFFEMAREKSFTRAVKKLFLTQPAVSLQVKALEEEREPEISGRDNLRTLALVEACWRGAHEHRVVTLDEVSGAGE